jgi:arylsulfatase A-like enzyme
LTKRVLVIVVAALLASAVAAFFLRPERGVPADAPSLDSMAREVGTDVMTLLWRGHVPGRSGEIMLVPKPHHFLIGEWDLSTLGTDAPTMSTSHPNPWGYLTQVPIVLHGEPWVPSGVTNDAVTDIAALAPTYAELLGIDGDFEGPPLDVSVAPKLPKVIFTVVIDGGGWNTLHQHAHAWPHIQRLMDGGTTYTNATIGSAPSITGALHATFGTGVYPRTHGIPGNQMRGEDGKNTDTWLQNADPRYLDAPTVSELWDEQTGNEAVVGTVSYEGWHLGMIGHGAQREGGDKDIGVLWEAQTPEGEPAQEWFTNTDYYALPDYLPENDVLERYEEQLDARDGTTDDTWFGHTLEQLREPLAQPGTPAFVRFTGDAVIDVLENEKVGADRITDMFWVEMKMPDYAGHAWNVINAEQEDVLRETDAQIGRMWKWLDDNVGKGNYVVALSADHGQQPLPDLEGGWRINNRELQRDIEARFGDVIEKVTPVDIYIDHAAVDEAGLDIDDIARFVGTYTIGENIPDDAEGRSFVPEARLDDLLFAGALTTGYFESLSPADIAELGDGAYEEGDIPVVPLGDG